MVGLFSTCAFDPVDRGGISELNRLSTRLARFLSEEDALDELEDQTAEDDEGEEDCIGARRASVSRLHK